MLQDELFLRRCRGQAAEKPALTLVQLWLYLRQQQNFESGFSRDRCASQAERARAELEAGKPLSSAHPVALLRAVDEYLAVLESAHEPTAVEVRAPGKKGEEKGTFLVVPRRPGWTSSLAAKQSGHLEYWMRRHQILPAVHRDIAIEIRPTPEHLKQQLGGSQVAFASGGFVDGILPDWNQESPYRCGRLVDPEGRWRSIQTLLIEAAERQAALLLLPELTLDRAVRGQLRTWLRDERHGFSLVVAGSFHEDDSGVEEGPGPRRNVARVFDAFGDEVLRQVKLRPMRAMPNDQTADEDLEGGTTASLLHIAWGLMGVAICLDFCESGDAAVTDLWRAVGPALVLVPSMGSKTTNDAHREKAKGLIRQHGMAVLVASQDVGGSAACGLCLTDGRFEEETPVLYGSLRWTAG